MYSHPPGNYQYYRQGPHYPSEHGTPVMPPNPAIGEQQYAPPPAQPPAPIPMETNETGMCFHQKKFEKKCIFDYILK